MSGREGKLVIFSYEEHNLICVRYFGMKCEIVICITRWLIRQEYIFVRHVRPEKIRLLFRVVVGQAYRGLTGGFLLLRIFSVGISVSPHVCFILD